MFFYLLFFSFFSFGQDCKDSFTPKQQSLVLPTQTQTKQNPQKTEQTDSFKQAEASALPTQTSFELEPPKVGQSLDFKQPPSALLVGAGAFGLSFAQVISNQFKEIIVLGRNKKSIDSIQKNRKSEKLPQITLSNNIQAYYNWSAILDSKIDVLLIALPFNQISSFISKNYDPLLQIIEKNEDISILSLSKGFSVSDEGEILFVEDLFQSEFQTLLKTNQFYALSGPSFALELAQKQKTTVSLAGSNKVKLNQLEKLISTEYLKIESTQDTKGVFYTGAIKNVMAILAGMAKGLNLAQNSQTALILKGHFELMRVGKKLGVKTETYLGPAYFGDLILSLSQSSRNSHLGFTIGQGTKLSDYLEQKPQLSIEGLNTIKELYKYTKNKTKKYPLINTLYEVLYEDKPVSLLLRY